VPGSRIAPNKRGAATHARVRARDHSQLNRRNRFKMVAAALRESLDEERDRVGHASW